MCSIIGFNSEIFDAELVSKICYNSRIRGLHSFGYSFFKGSNNIVKKFLRYEDFKSSLLNDKPLKFIAHFRYSTSGDFENEINNQPILKDNMSLVFNGVIDMSSKKSMEIKYGVELETENDGELALIKKIEGNESLEKLIRGKTFAGAFLDENEIYVVRNNNRPCYIGFVDNCKILASTKDILKRSGVNEIQPVKPYEFTML